MPDSTHYTGHHHYTSLKVRGADQDANNLNRLEELMQFSAGRNITPEEGQAVTHLNPAEQREFTREANLLDRFRREGPAP